MADWGSDTLKITVANAAAATAAAGVVVVFVQQTKYLSCHQTINIKALWVAWWRNG